MAQASREREESFGKTLDEINAEKAAALGRIARTLEKHLARLHELRAELGRLGDSERGAASREYEDLRRKADLYFWYLQIQREVLGLVDQRALERAYPIPDPLEPQPRNLA